MLPLALLLEAGLRHRLTSNAAVAAVMMGTLWWGRFTCLVVSSIKIVTY